MKLLTLLISAFLAAAAIAAEEESSSSSPSPDESSKAPDPIPVGQLWTAAWTDDDVKPYTKSCEASATLKAEIYKLGELYPALKTWAPELKVFYNKQLYPGSWNGEDRHGTERELMKMGFQELPFAVREWLKKNPTQRRFSIQDDVVFFAPGAIYPILPLFVDEAEGSECEGVLEELDNYSNELKDGAVVGRLTHKSKDKNEVVVEIEAFRVTKAESQRDEL